MSKYSQILNEFVQYYQDQLNDTLMWNRIMKGWGNYSIPSYMQERRNISAKNIKNKRNKLNAAKELREKYELSSW